MRTDETYENYTRYGNIYNKLKHTAKENHYFQTFNKFRNDIKNTRKTINNIMIRLMTKQVYLKHSQ